MKSKGEWVVNTVKGIRVQSSNKCICLVGENDEEDEANAHLMAASPRLYEELAKLVHKFRVAAEMAGLSESKIDAELDEAKQSLAKAGGER